LLLWDLWADGRDGVVVRPQQCGHGRWPDFGRCSTLARWLGGRPCWGAAVGLGKMRAVATITVATCPCWILPVCFSVHVAVCVSRS